jgi:hypothetical protein
MSHSVKSILASITSRGAAPDPFACLAQDKKDLVDFAAERFRMRSFADLGGVWNVDGGYTFYALQKVGPEIEKAFLVDTDFTDRVLEQKTAHPALQLIEGNFGSEQTVRQIGTVDAVFFFDTLLHQVKPDWDKILELYAPAAKCFLILNQQFVASEKTVRLLDLGEEEYFKNVPHAKAEEPYKSLFKKMYEMHPQHQRINRDIHNIWQWGITDDDLVAKMNSLGFKMQFYKNAGAFGWMENPGQVRTLPNFENHAFLFSR